MPQAERERKSQIVRVSIVGIATNIALAAFKAVVGIVSNSIAITLDAVNNLSDAASSAITIVGTKLAGKAPDHDHPYGHGRAEYLTTMVVAGIVLWAGLTSLVESVRGIIHPETPHYETVSLAIIAVAVLVKLVLGRYVKGAGKRLGADALVASGEDASFDAIISASTLVAAVIYIGAGMSLEAPLGAIISAVIVKSGVEMLREALDKVLGARVDAKLSQQIREIVCSVEGVRGAYDLILADYGPQRLWGSVHVEVDEAIDAREVDRITRDIQNAVMSKTHVILHTVGIYSTNTQEDSTAHAIHQALDQVCATEPHILQTHGLYVDSTLKFATFDMVVSFDERDRNALHDRVLEQMQARFPDYSFTAIVDADITD